MLTAAHCTDGTVGKAVVTFDPVIDLEPPSNLPRATDDTGTGTSTTGYETGQVLPEGYSTGTAYTHPDYSDFTDLDTWNDVGVIVLDEAVEGIEPAALAPQNYLDRFTPARSTRRSSGSSGTAPRSARRRPVRRSRPRSRTRSCAGTPTRWARS